MATGSRQAVRQPASRCLHVANGAPSRLFLVSRWSIVSRCPPMFAFEHLDTGPSWSGSPLLLVAPMATTLRSPRPVSLTAWRRWPAIIGYLVLAVRCAPLEIPILVIDKVVIYTDVHADRHTYTRATHTRSASLRLHHLAVAVVWVQVAVAVV